MAARRRPGCEYNAARLGPPSPCDPPSPQAGALHRLGAGGLARPRRHGPRRRLLARVGGLAAGGLDRHALLARDDRRDHRVPGRRGRPPVLALQVPRAPWRRRGPDPRQHAARDRLDRWRGGDPRGARRRDLHPASGDPHPAELGPERPPARRPRPGRGGADEAASAERQGAEHLRERPAVHLALHVRAELQERPAQLGVLLHHAVRADRHHGHARHRRPGRGALVVDPEARRQVRRRSGLHEQHVVQDPRPARGHEVPRAVRRAVRPQPREHDRLRGRDEAEPVRGLARPPAQRDQAGGRRRPAPAPARRPRPAARRLTSPLPEENTDTPHGHPRDHRSARRPPGRRSQRRARADGLDVVGHHDRPQADRDHVPGPDLRLLPARRDGGAAHPAAAQPGGQHAADAADVQRADHDARDDDGLPVRRPGHGGLRELLPAADDRRARHGVPQAQRAVVLAARRRRPRVLRVDLLLAARVRLALLPAAVVVGLPPERRRRRVDLPRPPHRPELARRRRELLRDDREHARARHGRGPPAAVRVGDPDLRDLADPRPAGRRGRRAPAPDRPPLRDALLRRLEWRLAIAVPAPVLVLRAPRGLHHGAAGLRHHLRGPAGLRPQADLRLQGDRRVDRRDRVPEPARVGAPHVHDAVAGLRVRLLHDGVVPHRRAHGGEDLQLGGDAVARDGRVQGRAALRGRLPRHVPHRRDHRHLPGDLPDRLAAPRHVLRRRPLPLRAHGRRRVRGVLGRLLLVPEDHRAADERRAGQAQLLADADRVPRHVPDPALDRDGRHAATHLRVRRHRPPRALQPDLDDRLVHPGRRHPRDGDQRGAQRHARRRGRAGPVEGEHARVVHLLAAAGQQLRRHPARPLGRADEGHPPASRAPGGQHLRTARAGARVDDPGLMDATPTTPRPAVVPVGARQVLADYVALTKPKVQSLLLLTTITTMLVAGRPSVTLIALTCLGGYLSAGGAGAINHWYDRDVDARMARTADRPVASGRVSPRAALVFGCVLGALSFAQLSLTVNVPAASLALAGFLGYTLMYTVWLKRRTWQNIVWGGAAGAMPPLVGWAAVTGGLDGTALYLFAIVFFWTPPHFWALSLLMKDEYAKVGIPMLPVVRGEAETRRQILLYTLLLYAVTQLPFCAGGFGGVYLAASLLLGAAFIGASVLLYRRADRRSALRVYLFSLLYLALLFCAMVADVHL